jgi:DNA-binding LacI/PurR family transcriptional regulator
MEELVSYACSMGHRRIAFIYGEPTAVTQNRKIGFHRACEANGLQIPKEYVAESRFYDPETCYSVTKKILSLPERPTCILFPDDFSLAGGVRAIQEAGLRIPDDISVIGYDGIIVSQLMSPKITTMQQDTDRLGKEAAVKLIELIERPNTTLLDRIIVPGKLLKGDSVKKLV